MPVGKFAASIQHHNVLQKTTLTSVDRFERDSAAFNISPLATDEETPVCSLGQSTSRQFAVN
jgi:hypothetical protein